VQIPGQFLFSAAILSFFPLRGKMVTASFATFT
jgi:hypothetical protein